MLPSKAERILSRYRPIAPKPLPLPLSLPPPLPPSATTDPSSTCASIDSFTSSAKCKKPRKRSRPDDPPAAPAPPKAPKSFASAVSNTGGASSLTQGASDGTVPLGDLRPASQLSLGSISIPRAVVDMAEMPNGASQESRSMASDPRFTAFHSVAAPLYISDAGNFVQYVPSNGAVQQQQQQRHFTILHQPLSSPVCNPDGAISMDRDAGFMERAAAALSMATPETSSSVPMCEVGCPKGASYAGGGFTEMIRGITRLPTAADVQSLMQARASSTFSSGQGAGASVSSPVALRLSPTSSKEVAQRKFDYSPLSNPISHNWIVRPPSSTNIDQMCDNDTDLVTLPLLPNVPSRMCSSSTLPHRVGSPSNQMSSPSASTEAVRNHEAYSQADQRLTSISSRSAVATSCPLFSTTARKVACKLVVPGVNSTLMQVSARPVMANGAVIGESYLEQVYGSSTDPVLLLDDSNQVLWYNKSYDKALKSASERFSGKTAATGPYIDPLGHPTPLGTFVFPCTGKHVQATLWGFLRKLVIQANDMSSERSAPGPSSQLHLSVGCAAQKRSPTSSEPATRMSPVICSRSSWMTTMTLESVTDAHMDVPSVVECVEVAEARLGAGNVPAFISDCLNRVRWANVALRQMFSKMGLDGSGSALSPSNKAVSGSMCAALVEPAPFVVCCTEKIPCAAWAFSCRVNIEWIKGGRRRSMTVPCDVMRVISNIRASDVYWAWQFDMVSSLCLNAPS